MAKEPETKTEDPAIEGGPPKDGEEFVDVQDESKKAETKTEEKVEEKEEKAPDASPIYSSSAGEFNTEEELIAHTKSLERKVLGETPEELASTAKSNADKILGHARDAAKENRTSEDDLADKFLTDTPGAIKQLKDELRSELKDENAKSKAHTDFWSSFYDQNQDLQRQKEVVKFVVGRDWDELKGDKDLKAVREKIAKKTRDFISSIRKDAGEETEITAKGTSTSTGASSTVSSSKSSKAASKPTSFVDEVRSLRQKRA